MYYCQISFEQGNLGIWGLVTYLHVRTFNIELTKIKAGMLERLIQANYTPLASLALLKRRVSSIGGHCIIKITQSNFKKLVLTLVLSRDRYSKVHS